MASASSGVHVRAATAADADAWARLRCLLWPDGSQEEHRREVTEFFAHGNCAGTVLVAEQDARIVGFAEVSIRPYAEGCRTDRVGYLEGWFVVPEVRRRGIGQQLLAAAEHWARGEGCSEFASDAEIANEASAAAHGALGFTEAAVVRCFRKDL